MIYVFREIVKRDELIESFRIRYKVYKNSELAKYIEDHEDKLDVDQYDLLSRHFGLFLQKKGKEQMIGTRRIVHNTIIESSKRVLSQISFAGKNLFPSSHLPIREHGNQVISKKLSELEAIYGKSRITEPSRLAILEESRNSKTGLRLLYYPAAIYKFLYGQKVFVFICQEKHVNLYKKLGGQLISEEPLEIDGNYAYSVLTDFKNLSTRMNQSFKKYASQYQADGQITS